MFESAPQYPPIPPDDTQRNLTFSEPDTDNTLSHIGLVGDTYTITVSGDDTNGRFCVIDMHIPSGGGPAPHRHDSTGLGEKVLPVYKFWKTHSPAANTGTAAPVHGPSARREKMDTAGSF